MGKREERRKRQLRAKRRKLALRILAGLAGAAILIFVVILPLVRSSRATGSTDIIIPASVDRPMVNEDSIGNTDAPVKIINISNYHCGHCANFALDALPNALSEEEIIEEYIIDGQVQFTYLPYSWSPEEPNSAEEATYCAMEQGKFWEYRDMVFSNANNQAIGGITRDNLIAFAELLDLDMDTFETCFDSQRYLPRVKENVEFAKSVGLEGTPSFLVNDKLVFASQLIQTIEEELDVSQQSASTNPSKKTQTSQEDESDPPVVVNLDDILVPETINRPQVNGNSTGNPKAPVEVTYVSNYGCGICSNFVLGTDMENPSEQQLLEKYIHNDQVFYSYIPRSWDPETPYSAEEATYCASEQGKFWEYRDMVFLNKDNPKFNGTNQTSLRAYAEKLGLDMNQFNSCFDNHTYLQNVSDDVEYVSSIGPLNTLFFLVNDKTVFADELFATIEEEL